MLRIRVRALEAFSNGTIDGAQNWKAGELRCVTMSVYQQLIRDHPTNWLLEGTEDYAVQEEETKEEVKRRRHRKDK